MTNSDMVKYLGSQSRVSEILNKKENGTLGMIKLTLQRIKKYSGNIINLIDQKNQRVNRE